MVLATSASFLTLYRRFLFNGTTLTKSSWEKNFQSSYCQKKLNQGAAYIPHRFIQAAHSCFFTLARCVSVMMHGAVFLETVEKMSNLLQISCCHDWSYFSKMVHISQPGRTVVVKNSKMPQRKDSRLANPKTRSHSRNTEFLFIIIVLPLNDKLCVLSQCDHLASRSRPRLIHHVIREAFPHLLGYHRSVEDSAH